MTKPHSETQTGKAQGLMLGNFRFAPRLIPSIAALIVLGVLLQLGFWQLRRADEKQALAKAYASHRQAVPIPLASLKKDQNVQYYPLVASGHFDNQHQFLLDNKIHQRRVGYELITPFVPRTGKKILLINRGWIPQGASRQQLPRIKPVLGLITIKGVIKYPTKAFVLSHRTRKNIPQWPRRIQAINLTQMAQQLGKSVYPFIIQLDPKSAYGFVRDWQPINMRPEKHLGYAVQWFALAATLIVIFLVMSIKKIKYK